MYAGRRDRANKTSHGCTCSPTRKERPGATHAHTPGPREWTDGWTRGLMYYVYAANAKTPRAQARYCPSRSRRQTPYTYYIYFSTFIFLRFRASLMYPGSTSSHFSTSYIERQWSECGQQGLGLQMMMMHLWLWCLYNVLG